MFSTEDRYLVRASGVAMIAASLCWLAAQLTGPGLSISGRASSPTQVPWGAVLMATAAGALAALVLVRVANRTTRPRRTFAVAVIAGLTLSCAPPVQAATTTRTALVLLVMHLIVAVVLVPPAARLLQPPPPSGTSLRSARSPRSRTSQPTGRGLAMSVSPSRRADVTRQWATCAAAVAQVALPALLPPRFDTRDQPPNVIQPRFATFAVWLPIFATSLSYAGYQALPSIREQALPRAVGWPLAAAFACTGVWAPLLRKQQYWAAQVALLGIAGGAETARRRLAAVEETSV